MTGSGLMAKVHSHRGNGRSLADFNYEGRSIGSSSAAATAIRHPHPFGGQIMSRFGPTIIARADFTVISCSQCMSDERGAKGRGVAHYHSLSGAINRPPPPPRTLPRGTPLNRLCQTSKSENYIKSIGKKRRF